MSASARRANGWLPALALAAAAGCGGPDDRAAAPSPPTGPPPSTPIAFRFTQVAPGCGIGMTWTSGRTPTTQILEAKGGGVALLDADADGDLDVFAPNGATLDAPGEGPGCRLFENLGSMQFRDITGAAGLRLRRWGMGVATGDFDGDGRVDLYVTCFGPNALLRNLGDGRFEDVTAAAGVAGASWSTGAAFGDLDGDGDLDLYVANYLHFDVERPPPPSSFKGAPVFTGPRGLEPQPDVLYENLGDGTFRDVTAASGVGAVPPAFGLGAVIIDLDGDGAQDIFVGNDSMHNFLFRNRGGLRFEEVGGRSGLAVSGDGLEQSTMGIAIADVNGDGLPDVFTTNFSNDSNTLHVSHGGNFFDDQTRRFGLGAASVPFVGWAAGFYDLDHDGDEDLLAFNGHVYPNASPRTMDSTYLQTPLLFARQGPGFRRVEPESAGPWLAEAHCDRGAAFGDLDGDGDLDVVVVELNGPLRVLRNDGAGPAWIIVDPGPRGLGTRVELRGAGSVQTRYVHSGGSFISASDPAAHFGLPAGCAAVDLRLTWPGGHEQRLAGVASGQRIQVRR